MNEINPNMTVDDYLNQVSYAQDAGYVPSEFALKFVNFIKLVNGSAGESNKTPVLHYRMLDKAVADSGKDLINLVHRGAAKTTLLGEYLFLYLAVFGELDGFGPVPFAIYVSDSIDNGVKNMRKNLEFRRENSEFLMEWIPSVRMTDITWEFTNKAGNTLVVKGYGAKALSLDTPLYAEYGSTTMGRCKVGDRIFGADGKLTTITAKSEVFHKPMYQLELEDGRRLKVSEDHINPVVLKKRVDGAVRLVEENLTTKELLQIPLVVKRERPKYKDGVQVDKRVFIKNILPMEYEEKELPLDPYSMGAVLGGGYIDNEVVELSFPVEDEDHFGEHIVYQTLRQRFDPRLNSYTRMLKGAALGFRWIGLSVRGDFAYIPREFFYGSVEQRLSLVQGLMDTAGEVGALGRNAFRSVSETLCEDMASLVRSLGGTASVVRWDAAQEEYEVDLWMTLCPFRLERKRVLFTPAEKRVALLAITPIELEPSQCIAVDNEERQFVAGDCIRTHNTGVRGAKAMGKRPVLAVLDDLISDEDARSATVIASVEDTVYKAIDYALDPTRRKIVWSGTPFNAKDPLYKAVNSGAWEVNVYPVCEQFPCKKEDFRGSWEDRFTYEFVKKQYDKAVASGKIDTFNQELMLRIMSEEDRLIEDADIQWYRRSNLIRNLKNFNIYITTDFATSERTSADFSVISVWALNNRGQWFWVDGICKRQLLDQSIKDLFRFVQIYQPQSVGIEVTGQQQGFVSWIQQEMMDKNIFFNIASSGNGNQPGIRPTSQKFTRFNTVVPWFKQRLFFFPEELKGDATMVECMGELSLVAKGGFKSKHDDFIDTISMLSVMETWKPSVETTYTFDATSGMWDDDVVETVSNMKSYLG